MPRRDGQPTLAEIAAAQQPAPGAGGQLPPADAARAALAATRAAAGTAATAPPVVAPVVTVAAVNAAAAGILTAFGQFLDSRRRDQEAYLSQVLEAEIPELGALDRQQVISDEMTAEQTYAAKMRARLEHDLPLALSIPDMAVREAEVQKILDRERRYAEMRENAMAARTLGVAEQRHVEITSPAGGYWKLSDHVQHHDTACLAMSGKVWPHSILRNYHPPLHTGCPCSVLGIKEAQDAGLLHSSEQFATADQATQAMQVTEAVYDSDELDAEMAALEAVAQARWWKGSAGPGQYRSRRGDIGRGVRKLGQPNIAAIPDPEKIRDLGEQELKLRELQTKDLGRGARVMIEGELQQIRTVLAPGVFELENGQAVRATADTAMGIPADDEPEPDETDDVQEVAAWDDVMALAVMEAPDEAGLIVPGFRFAGPGSRGRTMVDGDGTAILSAGFFGQAASIREGVVLRHLGHRVAEALGDEGQEALGLFDQDLASADGIVAAFAELNRDGHGEDRAHALRLVAEAAIEAGVPLAPDAERLADGESVA